MQIKNVECWAVESSGTKTIKMNTNQDGDRAVSSMYINPLSDIEVTVTGFVSDEDTEGVELVGVDIANLVKAEDGIALAGNYLFIVEPYYKVVLEATGTGDIIVKTLF